MKLSFIIPAHNEEILLADCLSSILEEKGRTTYNIEIIVVNNASTDKTEEIARKFKDVIVVNEPIKGTNKARQAGLLASTGDLIANIDADSQLTPEWIKKAIENFSKDEKLIALSGPLIYHNAPKRVEILTRFFYYAAFHVYLVNRFVFNTGSILQGGNCIIRRDALDKIGGFDTSIYFYGDDADTARRLHKIGKVKFTFDLPIYSSWRRLKKEGVLLVGFRYAMNYFWIILFKHPWSSDKTVREIRIDKNELLDGTSYNGKIHF